jgi:two-component system sensor histidine kinase KdpD
VTHEHARRGRTRITLTRGVTPARRLAGFALAAFGLSLLTLLLIALREQLGLNSDIMLFLGLVVGVSLVGGLYPALATAIVGFLLLNYYFTPPLHQFTVAEGKNLLALVVFLLVAFGVSAVVDLAARRAVEAARARTEAESLSTVAGSVLRGGRPLTAVMHQVRETFGLTMVALLERRPGSPSTPDSHRDPTAWQVVASVGGPPCPTPAEADVDVPVNHDLELVLCGRILDAGDRRVVEAFAAQAAVALRQERLTEQAAVAKELSAADSLRRALLSAVSHDLRTPLASAKAAVTSLRDTEVTFTPADRDELLATAEESLDRLTRLVDNLLDMSRLQAGALGVHPQLIGVVEAIPRAMDEIGPDAVGIKVHAPDDVTDIRADPGLLQRILVNVLANALRYSPDGQPPIVTVSEHSGFVEVRVIDRGPGIPEADRERVFLPFQRLGDRDNETGVGLGLALSRGLAEAMGGTLRPEPTPGGGLTMTLALPVVEAEPADRALLERLDHLRPQGTDE